jgi:hypothetical protein
MENMPQKSTPTPLWKIGLIFGFPVGLGWIAGRMADAALLPSFGYWGSFAAGTLVAVVAAIVVCLLVYRLVR